MRVLDFLAELFGVIASALRLDPAALESVTAHSWTIPLAIVFLAVLSQVAAQAVVLAVNEVRGNRLLMTVAAAAAHTVLGYVVLGLAVASAGTAILGHSPETRPLIQSVMVSAAPLILGFLVLLPYSGPAVARALQVWSMLALWGIVAHEFAINRWSALLIAGVAWLGFLVVMNLLSVPLGWLRDRLWRLVTGRHLVLNTRAVMEQFPLPTDPPGEVRP